MPEKMPEKPPKIMLPNVAKRKAVPPKRPGRYGMKRRRHAITQMAQMPCRARSTGRGYCLASVIAVP
jgi:hypothetical protein